MSAGEKGVPIATAPPYPEVGISSYSGVNIEEQPPSYETTAATPNSLPPTYQSLYGEFRQVDNPKSLAQFLGKAFTAIINTVTAAVTIAFLNLIPLFMIIIGSINVHNCAVQPLIPIWLIVGGVAFMLKSAINFFRMKVYKEKLNRQTPPEQEVPKGCKNPFRIVLTIFALFSVVWFVIGSVWFFKAVGSVSYDDKLSENYCDHLTFVFAGVYAVFGYVLTALSICCCCCCCCCVCCRSRDH